jgi:hypothetical protein
MKGKVMRKVWEVLFGREWGEETPYFARRFPRFAKLVLLRRTIRKIMKFNQIIFQNSVPVSQKTPISIPKAGRLMLFRELFVVWFLKHTVACKAVAMQRPRE